MADQSNLAREAVLSLLSRRAPEATICPSEVARLLVETGMPGIATREWRSAMPDVHAAIDRLVEDGMIRLSWKGAKLAKRVGPYRISRDGRG